jgi:superfamily II DNA or RNA helicase
MLLEVRDMVKVTGSSDMIDDEIDTVCMYKPTAYYFIKRKFQDYDGVHFYRANIFPIGLLERVTRRLDELKVKYDVLDNRAPVPELKVTPTEIILRPYQEKAVKEFLDKQSVGILNASTGSGKTIMGISIIEKLSTPTIIYVPTQVLLYQWKGEIETLMKIPCGIIGDGQCKIEPITVAMYQTVARVLADNPFTKAVIDEWKMEVDNTSLEGKEERILSFMKGCGFAVFDETHFVAARTFMKVAVNTSTRYKLGLSATSLMRPDGANLAVIAGVGEVCSNITTSALIKDKYLSPLIVKIVTLEDMDEISKKKRGSKEEFQRIKKDHILGDERNTYIVRETKALLDEKRTVLVLVTEIEHGKLLKDMLERELRRPVKFLCGQVKAKNRMVAVGELKKGTENLIITTSIFEYGLDVPRLSGLIIASPSKSMIRTIQRVGRILRPFEGKANAKIVDFDDTNADYFREHFIERMKFYSSEPEFKLEYDGKRPEIKALVERPFEVKEFLYEWENR